MLPRGQAITLSLWGATTTWLPGNFACTGVGGSFGPLWQSAAAYSTSSHSHQLSSADCSHGCAMLPVGNWWRRRAGDLIRALSCLSPHEVEDGWPKRCPLFQTTTSALLDRAFCLASVYPSKIFCTRAMSGSLCSLHFPSDGNDTLNP